MTTSGLSEPDVSSVPSSSGQSPACSPTGTPRSLLGQIGNAFLVAFMVLLGLGLGGVVAIVIGFLTGWISIC